MSLLPTLSSEIQSRLDQFGTALPVMDANERILMLIEPVFASDGDQGYSARIPGINAVGEGDTKENAALALQAALQSYMQTFG